MLLCGLKSEYYFCLMVKGDFMLLLEICLFAGKEITFSGRCQLSGINLTLCVDGECIEDAVGVGGNLGEGKKAAEWYLLPHRCISALI